MAAMTLVSERIGQYFHDGHRIEYTEYGSGERWVVLVHGQLMPRRMHQPLARHLAGSGSHVVTVDLLGHGRSDRPSDPLLYSTSAFGEQVVGLLDHLGATTAVLGGTSLGANVSLEAGVGAPERVQGLLLEMPRDSCWRSPSCPTPWKPASSRSRRCCSPPGSCRSPSLVSGWPCAPYPGG